MPIKVPNKLPAVKTLTDENVFVMTDTRAMTQDIRPLQILILNLMPTKVDTETQLTRLLGNTPLQVELELLQTSTHKASNTSEEHMIAFYKTFDQVKHKYYDGMIITGAPVELMDFEEVEYWEELCQIMEWSKRHVHSTFHICWGAQAGLYYHYGIKKHILPEKLSGVYRHHLDYNKGMLFRGFDDEFYVPHSRNTTVRREDVEHIKDLKIIASSDEAGIFAIKSDSDRQIFIMGHSEYDGDTLKKEYERDKAAGINPKVPCNYFPDDDDSIEPIVRWRSCANLLYSNWLNYFVYQSTPYDINKIHEEGFDEILPEDMNTIVTKFGGTSLADAQQFKKVAKIIKSDANRKYVVVSAPGRRTQDDIKITDLLIECANPRCNREQQEKSFEKIEERFEDIIADLDLNLDLSRDFHEIKKFLGMAEYKDYLLSRGEYLTGRIMAEYIGYDFLDPAGFIHFREDGSFNEDESIGAISRELKNHSNGVIPGFYGSGFDRRVKTFDRGGSDITGALIAAGAKADIYENWTDVSGLLMADPKIVEHPLTVPVITYKELRELSYMGASVVHEDTVFPVVRLEIPINIRNTNEPDHHGTLIVKNADYYQSNFYISGISGRKGYTSITVEKAKMSEDGSVREEVLKIFEECGITPKNILAGIDSLNILVRKGDVEEKEAHFLKEIQEKVHPDNLAIVDDISLIAIVGREMSTSPAVAVKALSALANKKINVKLIDHGSGRINMLIGVRDDDYEQSIRAIYTEFSETFNLDRHLL